MGEDSITGCAKRRRSNNAESNAFSYAEVDDEELQELDDDFIEEPFAKKRTGRLKGSRRAFYRQKRVLADRTITQSTPGTYAYNSRRIEVTDPGVLDALNEIYDERGTFDHIPGIGHDFNGIRYAQYFGRLDKAGTIGRLWTIVLSSDRKVYQLNENEKTMFQHNQSHR